MIPRVLVHAASDAPLLDVDIMDTTNLENNVHKTRHCFFEINNMVIDDVREVLLTQRRARSRRNIMLREGQVYMFTAVPRRVVNR